MFSSALLAGYSLDQVKNAQVSDILVRKHVLGVFAMYTTSQILDIPEVNLFLLIPQNLNQMF